MPLTDQAERRTGIFASHSRGELDSLVSSVLAAPKYGHVCEDLIRNIGARELVKRRRLKDAVKATKSKLHQVGGAYSTTRIDYTRGLHELGRAVESGDRGQILQVCEEYMGFHASTRERIQILGEFYETIFRSIPPVRSVLDVGCGLNPLALPWMPLDEGVIYYAYDVYTDLIGFIREFMEIIGVQGHAEARDITQTPPEQRADLALILKTIPCIDQLDKTAGTHLLETLDADHLLVTFPVHTLGGRSKGMIQNYEARFQELIGGKSWAVERFEFDTELAFLVTKGKPTGTALDRGVA